MYCAGNIPQDVKKAAMMVVRKFAPWVDHPTQSGKERSMQASDYQRIAKENASIPLNKLQLVVMKGVMHAAFYVPENDPKHKAVEICDLTMVSTLYF